MALYYSAANDFPLKIDTNFTGVVNFHCCSTCGLSHSEHEICKFRYKGDSKVDKNLLYKNKYLLSMVDQKVDDIKCIENGINSINIESEELDAIGNVVLAAEK